MYPHMIRLRGPWELAVEGALSTDRVQLPSGWPAWQAAHPGESITMTRSFGAPRSLDADETVWLVWRGDGLKSASLNGRPLDGFVEDAGALEVEIGSRLQRRNELTAVTTGVRAPDVALVFRGPMFLRGVVLDPTRGLVSGRVVGDARRKAELQLLASGKCVDRAVVQGGEDFRFDLRVEIPVGLPVREVPVWSLELFEGANRWYSVNVVESSESVD